MKVTIEDDVNTSSVQHILHSLSHAFILEVMSCICTPQHSMQLALDYRRGSCSGKTLGHTMLIAL